MFDRFQRVIDEHLVRFTEFDRDCPPALREAIQYSLLAPGKRFRPTLLLLATEACGSPWEAGIPAACAVEMVHCYSLIHDDLPAMDDDDLRRGRPSNHKMFGEALAILAGDALLTSAFETLATYQLPTAAALRAVAELARGAGACGMVGGQVDDLHGRREHPQPSDVEGIHRRKTGALITAAVRIGAIVAQASEDELKRLTDYGRCLGTTFQIVDDLLDATGDPSRVGKRTGKDEQQGKLTYPGFFGVAASRELAHSLVEQACQAVRPLGAAAEPMAELARWMLRREH